MALHRDSYAMCVHIGTLSRIMYVFDEADGGCYTANQNERATVNSYLMELNLSGTYFQISMQNYVSSTVETNWNDIALYMHRLPNSMVSFGNNRLIIPIRTPYASMHDLGVGAAPVLFKTLGLAWLCCATIVDKRNISV